MRAVVPGDNRSRGLPSHTAASVSTFLWLLAQGTRCLSSWASQLDLLVRRRLKRGEPLNSLHELSECIFLAGFTGHHDVPQPLERLLGEGVPGLFVLDL